MHSDSSCNSKCAHCYGLGLHLCLSFTVVKQAFTQTHVLGLRHLMGWFAHLMLIACQSPSADFVVEARRCNSLWIASASACAFSDALVRGRGGSWWLLDKNHVFFGLINIMNNFDVALCNCFFFSEMRCSSDMHAGPVGPLWICLGATVVVSPSPVPRLCLCTCRASWQHNNNQIQTRQSCGR